MTEIPDRHNLLVIDSGGGYGGPGAFLLSLLKALNKKMFQPFAAFYFFHSSPETSALQAMGIPVFFLGQSRALENLLYVKLLSRRAKSGWLHSIKVALHLFLQTLLIDLPQTWKLLRILHDQRIDLIVLNNDVHYHRSGALAARLSRIPCICRKAGGIGEGRLLKKILVPWVDLFIAVSAATSVDQLENNPATRKVVTIFEGVDMRRFVPSPPSLALRRQLGISDGKKIVACISRIVEGKGHAQLIEAASVITGSYNGVVFLLVGDDGHSLSGPLAVALQQRVRDLGLVQHVLFTGWRSDTPEILSLADVFVHCPTTWIEGLGIAHLEAMAMAKPTVVSQNGGLPDAAVDGLTGFIVPPGNIARLSSAILCLLQDPELAARLGRNARHRVEELFNIEKNTRKLEAIFLEYSRKNRHASTNASQAPGTLSAPQSIER